MAVDPPAEAAAQLVGWARQAGPPGLRPVPPANVHLTLAFLGYRPASDVGLVLDAVDAAVAEFALGGLGGPIVVSTGGPVWLPPRRPKALALDVDDPSGGLASLRSGVAAALERAIGWEDSRRRFRPHLTVGRISAPVARGALPPAPRLRFSVDAVAVYRSFLDPSGARYERLGLASLR